MKAHLVRLVVAATLLSSFAISNTTFATDMPAASNTVPLNEKSVVDNTFVPKGQDEADAKFLRNIAHRAVEQERQRRKR